MKIRIQIEDVQRPDTRGVAAVVFENTTATFPPHGTDRAEFEEARALISSLGEDAATWLRAVMLP